MNIHLQPTPFQIFPIPSVAAAFLALVLVGACIAAPVGATDSPTADDERIANEVSSEATFAFARAKLLADRGELAAAAEAYDEALALGGDAYGLVEAAKFQLYLAQIARDGSVQSRHVDRAAELVDQAFRAEPQNHDVLRIYADVHWRRTDKDPQALERAQAAFEILSEDGDLQAMTSLAQIYLWQRRADEAADLLLRTTDLAPRNRMIQGMLVEALLSAGRESEAEGALDLLLELDPSRIEARVRLVELRSRRGDHDGAIEVLEMAPPDLQDRLRLQQLHARELHLAGRHREALAISDRMLEDDPRSPGYFRLRMSILVSLARYDEALDVLEARMETDDAEKRARDVLLVARLKERVGLAAEAEDLLQSELDSAPQSMQQDMRLALAGVLQRSGEFTAAAKLVEPMVATAEPEQLPLFAQSLAELKTDAGLVDEASRVLDVSITRLESEGFVDVARALRIRQLLDLTDAERWQAVLDRVSYLDAEDSPEEARRAASQLRADALAALGQADEAIERLAKGDEPPELRAKRLQLMLRHGRGDEARSELATLAEGGDVEDLVFVARVLQSQELHGEAIPYLRRAVEADDETLSARFMLGAGLERSGEFAGAAEAFRQLLDRAPNHVPTLNYLGYMWAERGENLDEALEYILRAVGAEPDNGAYVDSLGWVYYQLGRYEEARQHLEWASRLERRDPTVFHHLGDAYAALGQPSRALGAYRRALQLDSEADEGQELSVAQRTELRSKLEKLERSGP